MVNVRLLLVLAVCFMVDLASARPQFPGNFFPGNIGVQAPIGGVSLGVPSAFPFSFGQQQPAQQWGPGWGQQAPQQQVPQQQYPQQQVPQQQVPQQQVPQQQVPQQQVPQQQPTGTNNAPNSEGLGTRFDGESEPAEEHPCQNVDTATGAPNETGSDVTEQPCLGIGGGNRINPKQAALLSLVG